MELDLVCFISIDFLHQRQHLYRGGHSLHSLYSGLPHSHNLVLGHNHISCVLRPESWWGGFFKIYLGEENISDIKNIDNMRIFITHLSRVKYRTKRPPPPQRRITRIPTRPAANRGSGYNTPDLFWRKERKWLYLFLTQPWCWCWLPKKNMRYDKKSTFRYNKVNRCLVRYSLRATTTDQPTNRAPNELARPGPEWTKMSILGQIWSF